MISNFKLFPNFNISQNFVQNVQKQKNAFVLSWGDSFVGTEPNTTFGTTNTAIARENPGQNHYYQPKKYSWYQLCNY